VITDQLLNEISAGQGEKLSTLARRVPSYRRGRPATLGRLLRWAMHGVHGSGGDHVYLEAARTPSGWISTPAAISRFFAALTPPMAHEPHSTAPNRADSLRRQASDRARRKLEEMGI
jgi:hypothetical protein